MQTPDLHCAVVAGYYPGFKPESLPAVPGLEGERALSAGIGSLPQHRQHRCNIGRLEQNQNAAAAAGVGRVEANGEGASKFSKDQRVVSPGWGARHGQGTWQQYCVVPEERLIAVADSVSDTSAAQFFVNPVTVVGFVEVSLPATSSIAGVVVEAT